MIKTIAILAVGAALIGLSACAHKDQSTGVSTTSAASSTYAK